jgi:hypothetical protein
MTTPNDSNAGAAFGLLGRPRVQRTDEGSPCLNLYIGRELWPAGLNMGLGPLNPFREHNQRPERAGMVGATGTMSSQQFQCGGHEHNSIDMTANNAIAASADGSRAVVSDSPKNLMARPEHFKNIAGLSRSAVQQR